MANEEAQVRVWVTVQQSLGEVEPDVWAFKSEAGAWRKAAELIGVAGDFEPGDYERVVESYRREECYRGCDDREEECECEFGEEGERVDVYETSLEE